MFFQLIFVSAYAPVRDYLGAGPDAPFYMKFLAGAITGGVGSVIGNPFDVLKVSKNVTTDMIRLLTYIRS